MKDLVKIGLVGGLVYVAYQMLIKGQSFSQILPGVGCVGMYGTHSGGMGMSGIAPTNIYGGYATLSSASMSTRAERSLHR